jgi:competence protein ComEC
MAQALLERGGPEAGGVLAALVLGSAVVPVPLEVRDAFRVSGLSHALAASGFHLTVLLGAVMALARGGPGPLRWGLALGAMLLFLLLAGPQPSVVRAVVMGAMAFLVQESGRRSRPLGVLLLCLLLMLLLQPAWLLDVGFQLSVAATAGLLVTARPWRRGWRDQAPARRAMGWPWRWRCPWPPPSGPCPCSCYHFGSVPLYAVAANLAVDPLLTPLTLGAMAMAVVAVTVPALLGLLAWPLLPLTQLLLWISRQFAALPLAQWQLGRLDPLLVVLFSAGLLPWLLASAPNVRRWRRLGLLLMTAAMALHLGRCAGDHLLLVHEGERDLLVARHGGRGALVSRSADRLSCGRARQLATGLGLQRYDWVLVSDPVAAQEPECWQSLSATVVSSRGESTARSVQTALAPGASSLSAQAMGGRGLDPGTEPGADPNPERPTPPFAQPLRIRCQPGPGPGAAAAESWPDLDAPRCRQPGGPAGGGTAALVAVARSPVLAQLVPPNPGQTWPALGPVAGRQAQAVRAFAPAKTGARPALDLSQLNAPDGERCRWSQRLLMVTWSCFW